ncbi:helix-turn-helix domain-containing protein [Streptomyces odontomachi]|uniref:helix-turn-helix domain-containing protein n=1 Tax=Streptomyces odontomachi TaxID=2944940 RepID=UPI00210EEC23|nr:helix-turn-helix transcriptional regulator [Streptomyces sp. ODS25]
MAEEPETSDSMCAFGAVVKALREHAGLSRDEFGRRVKFSPHTVASIEQGRRLADLGFVKAAEDATGNTGAIREAFRHVARQQGLAVWVRVWAEHEAEAIRLCTYECRLVPGLLQTPAYARVLFENRVPLLSEEEVEKQLTGREVRRSLLTEHPDAAFSFVIEEHTLTRGTGGPDVTRELLDHLLELMDRRNVEIQVLPHCKGVHPGLGGPFRLAEMPEHQWFAYTEGQRAGLMITDSESIRVLRTRYETLRAEALTTDETRECLKRLRGRL